MGGLALGLGAMGLGSLIKGGFDYKASKDQEKAAREARQEAEAAAARQSMANSRYGSNARDLMGAGGYYSREALKEGLAGAGSNIKDYGNLARQDYSDAMGQARQDMLGGMEGAAQAYSPLTGMLGYANQAGGALSGMLGQDPFANFQADPGYQFRQQQGEQAINRAAAASGGRMSGRTMKDLAQFNSGLASQEFGNFAQRQLANQQNQMGMANQLAGLGGIGANAQGALAGMLYGGGQSLGQLGQNYGQGMSNMDMSMGTNLGNLAWQGGQAIGNSLWGQGQAQGNTYMGQMGADNALAQSIIPQSQAATPYAGGGLNALGNMAGNIGNMGLMYAMSGGGGGSSGGSGYLDNYKGI